MSCDQGNSMEGLSHRCQKGALAVSYMETAGDTAFGAGAALPSIRTWSARGGVNLARRQIRDV